MQAPGADLLWMVDAHARLGRHLDGITDEDVRRPTVLPGWSVGHVLTHLARNADSHLRRIAAASRGEVVDQYERGPEGRAAEIEAGARRQAAELVADVRSSAEHVDASFATVRPQEWTARSRDAGGLVRCLFELPARRWQEVEVHLVDLDVGVTHRDWPDAFVQCWLPRTRERVWGGLVPEAHRARFDDPAEELAWLYGRLRRPDLPVPPAWG
jgi:maleylpyruvate isomerase